MAPRVDLEQEARGPKRSRETSTLTRRIGLEKSGQEASVGERDVGSSERRQRSLGVRRGHRGLRRNGRHLPVYAAVQRYENAQLRPFRLHQRELTEGRPKSRAREPIGSRARLGSRLTAWREPRSRSPHQGAAASFGCICPLIHPSTRSSSRSSGSGPPFRISSWKALMSKRGPSCFWARSRSSRIFSWPIL